MAAISRASSPCERSRRAHACAPFHAFIAIRQPAGSCDHRWRQTDRRHPTIYVGQVDTLDAPKVKKSPPQLLNYPSCSDALQGHQKASQRLSVVDVEARSTTRKCRPRIVD